MANVLIFGSGYVTQFLIPKLTSLGHNVFVTTRQKKNFSDIEDLGAKPVQFGKELPEATIVVNTVPPKNGVDPVLATYPKTDFSEDMTWYGYLSTTGVYGNTHGLEVDETHPPRPITSKGRARHVAELISLTSGFPAHIFRISGIYGPERNPITRIKERRIHELPSGNTPVNRIHVEDICHILLASMNKPNPGRIYNVTDDIPSSSLEMVLYAAELINERDAVINLPVAEEMLLGPMSGGIRLVNNNRVKKELGVSLTYPSYREGLDEIVKAC